MITSVTIRTTKEQYIDAIDNKHLKVLNLVNIL